MTLGPADQQAMSSDHLKKSIGARLCRGIAGSLMHHIIKTMGDGDVNVH